MSDSRYPGGPPEPRPLNWPLGDYLITREIDHGHFGTVYEATHAAYGSIALKLIKLEGEDAGEKVEAERQGAALQQRFSRAHPGLVPEVFEHLPIGSYYAVAMELISGEPLTAFASRGPIDARRAAEIALAIASFLARAHQFRTEIEGSPEVIVHGDLKPAHVLLIPDGSIRVLDFGIAKVLAARKPATTNKWGSIDYASPERLESGHVNEHADFWSLGVILFEIVAGYRPFREYEGNPSRLESAIRRQEPRAALPPGVDAGLTAIITKLLSPQPELRYQSAAAVVSDLTAYLRGEPTTAGTEAADASQATARIPRTSTEPERISTPTEPLRERTPRSRRNTMARVLLLVLALLVISVVLIEGIGLIRAEEIRADIRALDVADVTAARASYERISAWAPVGLGTMRVRGPLRDRLVQLADRTILEYRADAPAIARAQWEQSLECLTLAREIASGDDIVAAKLALVRGRLGWMRARTTADREASIRFFLESARLDPAAPDPYLGLATVFAYTTRDLPALTQAIADAEQRGFRPGRRERNEFGDLHKFLAERATSRATAGSIERIEHLRTAASHYASCAMYFEGVHLGESEKHLAFCRSRLRSTNATLDRLALDTL